MNKERLLNVAKALRESKNPDQFNMDRFAHDCGTPACALGHYAARTDLQSAFKLVPKDDGHGSKWTALVASDYVPQPGVLYDGLYVDHDLVRDHFGLGEDHCDALFTEDGCGGAQTAIEAALFIEQFVATDGANAYHVGDDGDSDYEGDDDE